MKDGYLNLLKPPGISSNQALGRVKGILGVKKAGHAGTLDPGAAGVLPLCLGKGTRASAFLLDATKAYRAEMLLGITTDTQDRYGRVTGTKPVGEINPGGLEESVSRFRGKIRQVPPMYSALKRQGKPLYRLARQGLIVEREPREVIIYSLEIVSLELPRVLLDVVCSKGTYIRTLVDDLGRDLGVGAVLNFLLRTRSGPFTLEGSYTLEEVEGAAREGRAGEVLLPLDTAFAPYPRVTLGEGGVRPFLNGLPQPVSALQKYEISDTMVRVYSPGGQFLALGRWQGSPPGVTLKPFRVFAR